MPIAWIALVTVAVGAAAANAQTGPAATQPDESAGLTPEVRALFEQRGQVTLEVQGLPPLHIPPDAASVLLNLSRVDEDQAKRVLVPLRATLTGPSFEHRLESHDERPWPNPGPLFFKQLRPEVWNINGTPLVPDEQTTAVRVEALDRDAEAERQVFLVFHIAGDVRGKLTSYSLHNSMQKEAEWVLGEMRTNADNAKSRDALIAALSAENASGAVADLQKNFFTLVNGEGEVYGPVQSLDIGGASVIYSNAYLLDKPRGDDEPASPPARAREETRFIIVANGRFVTNGSIADENPEVAGQTEKRLLAFFGAHGAAGEDVHENDEP